MRPIADSGAGGHRTVTTNWPSVMAFTLPGDLERLALEAHGRHVDLPRVEGHFGADTGLDHLLDAGGIADRPAQASSSSCFMASSMTLITSWVPPEAVLSPWVAMDDGIVGVALGTTDLDRQGLGVEQEALALLPGCVEDAIEQDLALGRALVANDDRGKGEVGMSACGKAAEHRGVQHLAVILGLVGHAHQSLHRLARGRVDQRAAHDRAVAPDHLRFDFAGQVRIRVRPRGGPCRPCRCGGRCGSPVMMVAPFTIASVIWVWKSSATAIGTSGGDLANAVRR